ncbi:MAG: SMP-30/gluconolactonase/LRE family protein [Rhizobiaceae bacterium]|nr:SMP-30/gluconolactonase/LRE family protein [Rhizobiaceae bacterium]MCV0405981.1 SMP-30/gluconolactonase/LRE family protein [Rhizobiaceae bacterium]
MSEAAVTVLDPSRCHLGEGPSYDPDQDVLFWFDIVERKLMEHRFAAGETVVHDLPVMASAIATVDEQRQLLVTETGLCLRERASGAVTLVIPVEADNPATRSNDARVHPSGALWFGTMGRKAERHAGAIYWHRGGEVRKLYPDITIPNSICFSPDGAVAYFADTAKNILFRVSCDPATGLPNHEPTVFLDHRGQRGGLDGSVVDADGVIWNARWGVSRLDAYGPDAVHLRSVPMPTLQVSCPAFVGKSADRLAVTSAWQDMGEAAREADSKAGMTFLVDLAVRGQHEPRAVV